MDGTAAAYVNNSGVVVGICTEQRGDRGFIITPQ
jgi:hypothetical protein